MTLSQLPESFVRRTLRTWAVANLFYAAGIGAMVCWWIPWKTPAINILVLAIAGGFVLAGCGLWTYQRWAWRLAACLCVSEIVLGVVVVVGLLMSWAYLYGIYGDFGYGTAIACLGIAMLAFEVLGLFAALELRALLRQEVRAYFGIGRWSKWIWKVSLFAISCMVGLAFAAAWMPTEKGLPDSARRASVQAIQSALGDEAGQHKRADWGNLTLNGNSLYLTIWYQGRTLHRFKAQADTFGQAVKQLQAQVRARRQTLQALSGLSFRFDYVVGTRSIWTGARPLLAMSLRPGIDGLRSPAASKERLLLPDDFIQADVFGAAPLVPGIAELRLGFDVDWALRQLKASRSTWIERIRVQSWLGQEGRCHSLYRGNTKGPKTSGHGLAMAAVQAGNFILAQITPDNRFNYIYLPYQDLVLPDGNYSIARHAGTVYSLMLLFSQTGHSRFRQGAFGPLSWLMSTLHTPCIAAKDACLLDQGTATVGSAALSAIAALEYQRRTNDTRFAEHARALLRFVLQMQASNGDFRHFYYPGARVFDDEARTMFYSEEAALALVLGHRVLGDAAYLRSAERALNFLTKEKYQFFLGWFIYGADHWTCIAAQEAWPYLKHRQYLDFCQGYAEFLRRLQYEPGRWDNQDFQGHYGFSSLLVPQAGAAAGFTEALISTYQLAKHHGQQDPELMRQIKLGLGALLREQSRSENAYLAQAPQRVVGGFRRSLVESDMRIDFTQHALSALIRGAEIF